MFKKNKDGLFICEECEKLYKTLKGLSIHIRHSHNKKYKNYYDKWLKTDNEGKCKICGKETEFTRFKDGYKNCCSKGCFNKYTYEQIKKSILKSYGVENIIHIKGVEKKSKQTRKERYGDENYNNLKKGKKTCLKKYGVENPTQNKEILEKIQKSTFKIKKFRDTDLWYQGSYELDFLERYYDKYPNITRGPLIKYKFNNKDHYYFSDYLISSKNLVIEIKSTYYYNKYKEKIKAKKEATLNEGFNYIMILDKNYIKFLNLIK